MMKTTTCYRKTDLAKRLSRMDFDFKMANLI